MFKIGDRVIYGSAGICTVNDISTIDIDGVPKDKLYYILNPETSTGGTVFAPVENCKVAMRKMLDAAGAEELIASIPAIEPMPLVNDKAREALYREAIKSCDCRQLIVIIKTLYLRGKERLASGKRLSSLDERYLKQAEEKLYVELAAALGIEKNAVGPYITSRMDELLGE